MTRLLLAVLWWLVKDHHPATSGQHAAVRFTVQRVGHHPTTEGALP